MWSKKMDDIVLKATLSHFKLPRLQNYVVSYFYATTIEPSEQLNS